MASILAWTRPASSKVAQTTNKSLLLWFANADATIALGRREMPFNRNSCCRFNLETSSVVSGDRSPECLI